MKIKSLKLYEYTFLSLGLVSFIVLFYIFRHNKSVEILITAIYSLLYSIWGMVHHKIEGRLTFHIALEYLLMSLLVFMVAVVVLSSY